MGRPGEAGRRDQRQQGLRARVPEIIALNVAPKPCLPRAAVSASDVDLSFLVALEKREPAQDRSSSLESTKVSPGMGPKFRTRGEEATGVGTGCTCWFFRGTLTKPS